MLAEGGSSAATAAAVDRYSTSVVPWKQRFEASRLAGLEARYHVRPARVRLPVMEARVLAKTPQAPRERSTQKRTMVLGVSHEQVARIWRRAGLQSPRLPLDRLSDDLDVEQKAAVFIVPYLNPPPQAVVVAAEHRTAVASLDRLDPVLLLSSGSAERRGFAYDRQGTLSVYAARNTQTDEVFGQIVSPHASASFSDVLGDIEATQLGHRESHVIVNDLSAHQIEAVSAILETPPRVQLHSTPTCSSWQNHVKPRFGKIVRELQVPGIFAVIPALARKTRRYSARYNEDPRPIRWTDNDPTHRIPIHSADTVHECQFLRVAAPANRMNELQSRRSLDSVPRAPWHGSCCIVLPDHCPPSAERRVRLICLLG